MVGHITWIALPTTWPGASRLTPLGIVVGSFFSATIIKRGLIATSVATILYAEFLMLVTYFRQTLC